MGKTGDSLKKADDFTKEYVKRWYKEGCECPPLPPKKKYDINYDITTPLNEVK
jgi:hypothetical protein